VPEDVDEAQRREEAARERLRETESEAHETLDEAEQLEDPDVPTDSEPAE
jgi:hypothetical protein